MAILHSFLLYRTIWWALVLALLWNSNRLLCWNHLALGFFVGETFNDCIYFFKGLDLYHLYSLDLILVCGTYQESCPFLLDFTISWSISFEVNLMILWISLQSVVLSSFLFLTLLIWIFFLCSLVSLDKGLSRLLIFLKNQIVLFCWF